MTEEIVIFNRSEMQTQLSGKQVLRAIDNVTPMALQAVAGSEEDTQKVKSMISTVKEIASTEGRDSAIQYMTKLSAQVM